MSTFELNLSKRQLLQGVSAGVLAAAFVSPGLAFAVDLPTADRDVDMEEVLKAARSRTWPWATPMRRSRSSNTCR